MNVKLAIATVATIVGAAGGIYHKESSRDGAGPLNIAQQGLDDVRGFQDHMPVLRGVSEDVTRKVNTALNIAMTQCLTTGRVDADEYLAKKAEWPIDTQLQVRACCAKIANRDDIHFQFGIGERTFDTREGQVFFQKDIQCSSPVVVRLQKEAPVNTSNSEK